MICHLCSGHFLSHPFLYFCSEVLRSFLGHEYNAVTIGRLFPLGQHLCLIVVVLVGANAATLLVVCILKLFNAGRPTWLCAGTYDYYFFYIPLSACTWQSGRLFAITHASKGNCWLTELKCSPLPDKRFSLCPPVALDLCQWSMCVLYAVLCTCCSFKP